MKNIFTIFFAFSLLFANAQTSSNPLLEVNSEWKNVTWTSNLPPIKLIYHEDKIQYHLMEIISYLRAQPLNHLSNEQVLNRIALIQKLEVYAKEKIYPKNEHQPFLTPIFIDNYGTYCAVGHLMKESGASTLAKSISTAENLQYVKNIKTLGVSKWAKENGFSLQELALIQPTYFEPINTLKKVNFETPNPILKMVVSDDKIFMLTGDTVFSQYGQDFNANNIIVYNLDTELASSCNFPKMNFIPNDIAIFNGYIYAATDDGLFQAVIANNKMIELDWEKHPTIHDKVIGIYKGSKSIFFHLSEKNYSFYYNTRENNLDTFFNSTKNGIFTFNGEKSLDYVVKYIEWDGFQTNVYGMTYSKNGNLTRMDNPNFTLPFMVNRSLFHNGYTLYSGDITSKNGKFIGGLHSRYTNNSHLFGQFFDSTTAQEDWKVSDMISTGNRLYIIGKFKKSKTITTLPSSGIMELTNTGHSSLYPLPITNIFNEVYSGIAARNEIILSTDQGIYRLKHRLAGESGIHTNNITIYPNPVSPSEKLTVDIQNVKIIRFMDPLGREIFISTESSLQIPKSTNPGLYSCLVETIDGKRYTKKVFIE